MGELQRERAGEEKETWKLKFGSVHVRSAARCCVKVGLELQEVAAQD